MKVLVLAHDHESIVTRVARDRTVGGGRQRYIADMGRTGIQIVERCYESRCEPIRESERLTRAVFESLCDRAEIPGEDFGL